MSGGAAANEAGRLFEFVVGSVLRSQRLDARPQFKTGLIGEYGEEITVDFYVPNAREFPEGMYVECRWQNSSGSTNKKSNALADNIINCYDRPTIVVVGGDEMQEAYEVLVGKCRHRTSGHFRGVFWLDGFIAFAPLLRSAESMATLDEMFDHKQPLLFA
jgi:hypothetical protein